MFICLVTLAHPLEIVTHLTAQTFSETLKRFIAKKKNISLLFNNANKIYRLWNS